MKKTFRYSLVALAALVCALALVGCDDGSDDGFVASPTASILPGTWHMNGLEGNPQAATRGIPYTSVDFVIGADFNFTFSGYIGSPEKHTDVRGSLKDQGNDRYQTSLTYLNVTGVISLLTEGEAAAMNGVVFTVAKGADDNHITITVDQSGMDTAATNEAMVMDGTYTKQP